MKVHIPDYGEVDEQSDLWSIFQDDAHGRTGLFAGQLVNELSTRAPEWRPRLAEIIRRALVSDDPVERCYALHGRLHLQGGEFGEELEKLAAAHHDWLASAQSPAGVSVRSLFFLALLREPKESAAARRAFENARAIGGSEREFHSAWATFDPDDAIASFLASLDGGRDATLLMAALRGYAPSRFDEVVRAVAAKSIETRRRFVELARGVMRADQSPSAYDEWLAVAEAVGCAPESPPERPVDSEGMQRFTARVPEMIAGAQAPPPTLPDALILSAEVWVDVLRVPEGPPAELFALLVQKGWSVVTSEPLIAEVVNRLRQLGWDDAMIRDAESKLRTGTAVLAVADLSDPEVALAHSANVRMVFAVGDRVETVSEGVAFRPVHELISALRS